MTKPIPINPNAILYGNGACVANMKGSVLNIEEISNINGHDSTIPITS